MHLVLVGDQVSEFQFLGLIYRLHFYSRRGVVTEIPPLLTRLRRREGNMSADVHQWCEDVASKFEGAGSYTEVATVKPRLRRGGWGETIFADPQRGSRGNSSLAPRYQGASGSVETKVTVPKGPFLRGDCLAPGAGQSEIRNWFYKHPSGRIKVSFFLLNGVGLAQKVSSRVRLDALRHAIIGEKEATPGRAGSVPELAFVVNVSTLVQTHLPRLKPRPTHIVLSIGSEAAPLGPRTEDETHDVTVTPKEHTHLLQSVVELVATPKTGRSAVVPLIWKESPPPQVQDGQPWQQHRGVLDRAFQLKYCTEEEVELSSYGIRGSRAQNLPETVRSLCEFLQFPGLSVRPAIDYLPKSEGGDGRLFVGRVYDEWNSHLWSLLLSFEGRLKKVSTAGAPRPSRSNSQSDREVGRKKRTT